MTNEQYQSIPKWAIGLGGIMLPVVLAGAAWLSSVDTRVSRVEVRIDNIVKQYDRIEAKLDEVLERLAKP